MGSHAREVFLASVLADVAACSARDLSDASFARSLMEQLQKSSDAGRVSLWWQDGAELECIDAYSAESQLHVSGLCIPGGGGQLSGAEVVIVDEYVLRDVLPAPQKVRSEICATLVVPLLSRKGNIEAFLVLERFNGGKWQQFEAESFAALRDFLHSTFSVRWRAHGALQAEDDARRSHELLEQLEEIGAFGVWEYDFAKGTIMGSKQVGKFLAVGTEACPMQVHQFLSLIHPEDRKTFENALDAGFATIESSQLLVRIFDTLGRIHYCEIRARLHWSELGVRGNLRGILRDVSDRFALDALRAEREGALAAENARSAVLATISHELRTPLHGILAFARLGLERTMETPNSKVHDYFDEILQSGLGLQRLLDDVLDFARFEAGKVSLSMKTIKLNDVLADGAEEWRAAMAEKGLSLASEVNGDPVFCECDERRLRQVVRNVMSNAIKFSHPGSVITMKASLEKSEGDGCSAKIEIANFGLGIAEDELEMIFQRFVQGRRTRGVGNGVGLGLAICRSIVQGHGGRIWASSREDGETVFSIVLPAFCGGGSHVERI